MFKHAFQHLHRSSHFVFKIKYNVFGILLPKAMFYLIMKIINFRGDLTDVSTTTATLRRRGHRAQYRFYPDCLYSTCTPLCSDFVFKIKSNNIWDTFIHSIFLYIIQINNFRGDLTNILARTKTLPIRLFERSWLSYLSPPTRIPEETKPSQNADIGLAYVSIFAREKRYPWWQWKV